MLWHIPPRRPRLGYPQNTIQKQPIVDPAASQYRWKMRNYALPLAVCQGVSVGHLTPFNHSFNNSP